MSSVVLSAHRVGIRFGGLKALEGFSLQLHQGEVLGLIGPNGAGKTTAFNVLTGVYIPDEGEVRVCGQRVNGKKPHQICQHGLARTFQNIRLFRQMSVLDNVKVACAVRVNQALFPGLGAAAQAFSNYYEWWRALLRTSGFLRDEQALTTQAEELLQVMGLWERRHETALNLPYGEQRRLEIARALGTGPQALLLDEPAAGMNPREKVDLMGLILQLCERFSVGILLIEHDMKLVMEICKTITVLDHGETIAVGSPAVVRKDERVIAAYLGQGAVRPTAAQSAAASPEVPS